MITLAADIGGTNTRVAIFSGQELQPRHVTRFRNAEFGSLEGVLQRYLNGLDDISCSAACVAVAGPVRNGTGHMTNLAWSMDGPTLCAVTGASRAFVINDLEAQGHALDDVETRRVLGRNRSVDRQAARLVVGLGTGFNAAPVHAVDGGSEYFVVPSECGHVSLPVWDETSFALARALQRTHGFASVEEALSGRGLLAVNAFVAGQHDAASRATTAELIEAMAGAPSQTDTATTTLFCQILGRVLSDLALVHLPLGGIYLIGGLARALSVYYPSHGLAEGFYDKGRFSEFLRDFDIHIVEDDYAALTGCARYVRRHT